MELSVKMSPRSLSLKFRIEYVIMKVSINIYPFSALPIHDCWSFQRDTFSMKFAFVLYVPVVANHSKKILPTCGQKLHFKTCFCRSPTILQSILLIHPLPPTFYPFIALRSTAAILSCICFFLVGWNISSFRSWHHFVFRNNTRVYFWHLGVTVEISSGVILLNNVISIPACNMETASANILG